MQKLIKPKRLEKGNKVAAVTLSWGGPGRHKHRYLAGKRVIEEKLGLKVVEMKHTLAEPEYIYKNPQARAHDLMEAFSRNDIHAIFSTIGGNDSVRILKFLDLSVIRKNAKVFMGYSDTTVAHLACFRAGLVTFYGPSIMAGFAENVEPFQYMLDYVQKALFNTSPIGVLKESKYWTDEYLDWELEKNQNVRRQLNKDSGWRWIQGEQKRSGVLLGGNLEVLEFLKGTDFFPSLNQWKNSIFYFETSEDQPSQVQIEQWLRNYGVQGILGVVNGIVAGRPVGSTQGSSRELIEAIKKIVVKEFGRGDIPIVTDVNIGHVDPILTVPNGALATLDPKNKKFSINESGITA